MFSDPDCLTIFMFISLFFHTNGQISETKLSNWYKQVKDPAFECPITSSTTTTTSEDQSSSEEKLGHEVFQIVDCETPGARWDYNYKVSIAQ